mmetsp:Transcript_13901/g.29673  ORF Transcript_13901/g.29673 Transcript_13901/m.29673 type:complete len:209 (+) Transcript_13901:191-817(+)
MLACRSSLSLSKAAVEGQVSSSSSLPADALFNTSAGASPGTKNTAAFLAKAIAASPPTNVDATVVFRFPVIRDNIRTSCLAPMPNPVKNVLNVAICPTRSNLFLCRNPRNEFSLFCNMAMVLGENNLGANLLKIESSTIGTMKVNTPSSPGLSNSLDISTSARDSSALSLENDSVASFMVSVLSMDRFRICTSSKALLAPNPKYGFTV